MASLYEYTYTRHKVAEIPSEYVESPESAADIFRKKMTGSEDESLWVMALDADLKVVGIQKVATGTPTSVMFDPKQVFRFAVRESAEQIVVAHYHTIDNTDPSENDKSSTKRLILAGEMLGIEVKDALVVTDSGYVSILSVMAAEMLTDFQAHPEKAAKALSRAFGIDIPAEDVASSLENVLGESDKPN